MSIFKPKAELWLSEGKKRFAQKGITGINVEEMAKSIGIAKSSFYFLFKSKEQFLDDLYSYWEYEGTIRILKVVEHISDPIAKLQTLTEYVYSNLENDQFMLQLMTYAETDKKAVNALKKIWTRRNNYLLSLFKDLKISEKEAVKKRRIYTTYYYGVCQQNKFKDLSQKDLETIFNDIQEILEIKFYKK